MKLLLLSDLHLRDTQPIARTDDYWNTQADKVGFIKKMAEKYHCTLVVAGDFFDQARSSQMLEAFAIKNMPMPSYIIPGQHDLPNHSIKNINKSSLGVMKAAGFDVIVDPEFIEEAKKRMPGEEVYGAAKIDIDGFIVVLLHTMVYELKPIHDDIGGTRASKVIKAFPEADLIVTGDNHQSFVIEQQNKVLVNCGSMTRMDADQISHKPRMYLFDVDNRGLEEIYFPIKDNVISREHIEKQEEKDARISAFVKRIKSDYDVSLSYVKNLEKFFKANNTRKSVQEIIWEAVGK